MSWMKNKIQEESKKNKEIFKNRKTKYVTEKTIENVVDEICEALLPNSGEEVNKYGVKRVELNNIRLYRNDYLYKNQEDALLYYDGVMGDYGFRDILVIDRRCDFNDLLKALSIEFGSHRVNIVNEID